MEALKRELEKLSFEEWTILKRSIDKKFNHQTVTEIIYSEEYRCLDCDKYLCTCGDQTYFYHSNLSEN